MVQQHDGFPQIAVRILDLSEYRRLGGDAELVPVPSKGHKESNDFFQNPKPVPFSGVGSISYLPGDRVYAEQSGLQKSRKGLMERLLVYE